MNYEKLFSLAKSKGIEDIEIYQSRDNNIDLMVFNGAVDRYTVAESLGVSARGIYKGKMGYAYSEKDDTDVEEYLVNTIIESAHAIDNEDIPEIYAGDKTYKALNIYRPEFNKISMETKISMAKELEQKVKEQDEKIKVIDYLMYQEGETEVNIANSKGLDLQKKSNFGMLYVSAVASDGTDNKTASKHILSNKIEDFDIDKLSKEVSKEAVSLLGAKPVESGDYPIVLRHDVATTLLATFSNIFSGQAALDGTTQLEGKIGQMIASEAITLVDDPLNEAFLFGAPFDDEGVATKYKEVISSGKFTTFLHNMKTAKKSNVEPTGNGFKNSYKGAVVIRGTNFYFKPGKRTLQDLLKDMNNGLLITNIQGYHAGANPVTGEFSLQASGFLVEDGKVARGVSMITIAGNYYELLQDVIELGNDLEFGFSGVGSPSLRLKKLSVAG